MPELLRYGKEKGVKARLWMHWRALANTGNIDAVFATYQKWGIEGVMIDFLDRDDQEMVRFYTKVIQAAARHRLTVNFHGIWKPTGVERTYPNLLSHEGVMGSEYNKWRENGVTPEHELIVAFVRALAGSLDFHPGSFRPVLPQDFKPDGGAARSIGTLARQLATYVVLESGSQMLVDYPEAYLAKPEAFEFLRRVPVSWDETKVIDGRVGEFITLARRKGKEWYLGTFTDREARRIQVPLQFLGRGEFLVEMYADVLESRTDAGAIGITKKRVRADDVLSIDVAPSGGNAMRIFPVSAE
jgi:alpha-glucosidase